MKKSNLTRLAVLLAAAFVTNAASGSTVLISDPFTAVNVGSGFALTNGINSGVNPPITTRMTGTLSSSLRYFKTGAKNDSSYTIAGNKASIPTGAQAGRFTISGNGTAPYDFSPALGISGATPANPSLYDVGISMNNKGTTGRMSFALGTAEAAGGNWNFGIQIFKSGANYGIYKRIKTGASGLAAELNSLITTGGTAASEITFFIRVTDAGAESTTFNSRVQVSTNGGTSWIYDTATDTDLVSGWRFEAASRYFMFDQAINDGADTYDNFSVTLNSTVIAPASKTWSGLGSDDNWSTADNWAGVAPISGDQLVFAGTTRQINFNDIASLSVSALTFSNSDFALGGQGWTLTGPVTNLSGINAFNTDLAWNTTVPKTWVIASGSEVTLNNTNTVEVLGDHSIVGGGTLRLKGIMNMGQATANNPAFIISEGQHIVDGGTFASRGGYRIGSQQAGAGGQTVLTNGATFALTAAAANLRVGDSSNSVTAQLQINNSTLTMAGGILAIPYAAGATSILTQVGGKVSGAIISFSDNGVGKGTYSIKNGTLEAIQIREPQAGSGTITFDNAVLRTASGASNAFFTGLNSAQILSGGLYLDAVSDVTIGQVLKSTGFLVKSNSSTVTLTGANTYSGNTLVQGGKLVMPTVQNSAGTVQLADTTELGVFAKTANSTLTVGGVNFNGPSFNTLTFDLGSFTTPTNALLRATNLTVGGPVTINVINGLQLSAGQVTLIKYDGAISGGFQFTLGNLPSGVTANLVDNSANSSVDLVITGVPGLTWTGAVSGDWDGGNANWIDKQTGLATAYNDNLPNEFLDGATTGVVNIGSFVNPSIITVSNDTLPYIWSGGAITTVAIKKNGPGSLTRAETSADLINGIELNAGSFIVSNIFNATFPTVLTDTSAGTGTFVKQGASTLTITSTNSTFDGAFSIQQGTVKISNDRALGSTNGGVFIASGATLDLSDAVPGFEPITVSGDGVGGNGAIIDSTGNTAVDTNLRDVTLAGDTTFGCPNNGRWDIRVRSGTGAGPGLKGNGYNLTKVGSGLVSIACQRSLGVTTPYWIMNLGNVVINGGTLAFAESLSLGNPTNTIVVNAGAGIQFYDLNQTNPMPRDMFFTNSTLNSGGGNVDTNILTGTLTFSGSVNVKPDQCALFINGPIVGDGSFNMSANDPGRVYLNGINTYTGDTTVTNGTLGGTGVIAGNLIMLGGTNSPGRLDAIGTLTVNGNVALAGTTYLELNRALPTNSDRLVAGGTLAFGGALKVVLAAGASAPQANDVFQLFNKSGAGSFSSISLPTLATNLSWNTNNLLSSGSLSVTGPAAPPSIGQSYQSGTNFVFTGTGGVEGHSYIVLTSMDISVPVHSWTPVATNVFGPGGTFSVTNNIDTNAPAGFYILQAQ